LLRSKRKFATQQQQDLINDTREFAEQYKEKSNCNVTYKMHLLFAHLQHHIEKYQTVGIFSEDSMESIHAIVNRLDRVYASLDSEWKTKAILQSLHTEAKFNISKEE
jgi:hypothetical protein